MNKKVISIIVSLSLIAISIVMIILFTFIFNDDNEDFKIENTFIVTAEDLSISKGEQVYNYYTITDKNAIVEIEVDKENIIKINKEMIEGLNVGSVCVTLHCKNSVYKCDKKFNVTVYERKYKVKLTPVENCSINENNDTIFIYSNQCQFQASIFDLNDNPLNDTKFEILSDVDVVILKNISNFLLIANNDCRLIIKVEGYLNDTIINVISMQENAS